MSSLVIAGLVFVGVFASALIAMRLGRRLPESHTSSESKDVVKLGLGVMATLSALVLGLLVASAKGTFDAQSGSVKQMAANVLLLDRLLARYGPETKEARELFQQAVTTVADSLWPTDGASKATLTPGAALAQFEAFYDRVGALKPKTDAQADIKGRVLSLANDLGQTRLRLAAQKDSSIPLPFLAVLVFWLVVLFAGYGLLAPNNTTVVLVLAVCALSISTALFLILELDRPFDGVVRISSAPFRDALSLLGR